MLRTGPVVIAHRTCPRDAPENSLEGVAVAAALGADYVEVDVRRTRDGVPILMHDPLLRRTTEAWWPVRLTRWGRMEDVRLRGNGMPVPSLRDVLESLPNGVGVAIDLKDATAAAAVVAEVRRLDLGDRVLLWSQHGRAVRYFARAAPDAEVALLRDTHTPRAEARLLRDAERWGARAISVHQASVTAELIDRATRRGLRTYTWFQELATQANTDWTGLAGIVTDWVREAVQVGSDGRSI